MNKYECLYVIVPELNEEETKSVIEKFNGVITANGGMIENVDEWGKTTRPKATMFSLCSTHPPSCPQNLSVT